LKSTPKTNSCCFLVEPTARIKNNTISGFSLLENGLTGPLDVEPFGYFFDVGHVVIRCYLVLICGTFLAGGTFEGRIGG
jgi:hypothetical protein